MSHPNTWFFKQICLQCKNIDPNREVISKWVGDSLQFLSQLDLLWVQFDIFVHHYPEACSANAISDKWLFLRGKNNVLSANKQSYKLHIAVSIAFNYLHQCRVKTGGQLLFTSFHSALKKVAECYRNCGMQFVSLFIGAQYVVFSLLIICVKLRLTLYYIFISKTCDFFTLPYFTVQTCTK